VNGINLQELELVVGAKAARCERARQTINYPGLNVHLETVKASAAHRELAALGVEREVC